jgi:hypothetical protein
MERNVGPYLALCWRNQSYSPNRQNTIRRIVSGVGLSAARNSLNIMLRLTRVDEVLHTFLYAISHSGL